MELSEPHSRIAVCLSYRSSAGQRSEAEAKKAAYQEWLQKNELDSTGDAAYDGITVTDMGVSRTQAWVRTLDDGPDPPNGRSSSKHDGRASLTNLRAVAASF